MEGWDDNGHQLYTHKKDPTLQNDRCSFNTSNLLLDGQVFIESDSFRRWNFLITTGHMAQMIWNVLKVLDRKSSPKALRTLEVGEEG